MGFPSVWGGVLPLVVVNTAISIALVKNLVDTILRLVGFLKRDDRTPDPWPPLGPSLPMEAAQQQQQQQQRSPSFVEQVQSALPLVEFKAAAASSSSSSSSSGSDEEVQCAVCLCDFEEGQLVRELPHCSHIFHRDCLDRWLQLNHMTCPMCRSSLLSEDLALKHKQEEEFMAEELAMWLSVYHSTGFARGPWWYHTAGVHGSSFVPWDFH